MALAFDYLTQVISVSQADLTNITGTLYELDTDQFRKDLASEQDSAQGMPYIDMYIHNTAVTVAGTTFAQTIEIINGYTVEFIPDAQYSVRLEGSNNNIFDVEGGILVQNQVQLISQNSGGLITTGGGGLTGPQVADAVWDEPNADHLDVGSTGESLNTAASGSASAADIADAVWDEAASAHVASGSFGERVGKKLLDFAKWIALKDD